MLSDTLIGFDDFKALPHAVTLLGMSGIGKTLLSRSIHHTGGWFHYSADYRIGTRYLAEDIVDNIKYKIMQMRDPFVADLLRSDSIYINHNITVDNLLPVSTFLGMFGDASRGGLGSAEFLRRQNLYRDAEIASMLDVPRFIEKALRIYGCLHFINDASGSLCEIVDLDDPGDDVLRTLTDETLILFITPRPRDEDQLKERAHAHPKPMFYRADFIEPHLAGMPADGSGVDPLAFAGPLFADLMDDRKPRYRAICERHGFAINVECLMGNEGPALDAVRFLEIVHATVTAQITNARAHAKLQKYLQSCARRQALAAA